MKHLIEKMVSSLAKSIGVRFLAEHAYQNLLSDLSSARQQARNLALFRFMATREPHWPLETMEKILSKSKSQIGQDLFALTSSGFKSGGFFVEFGATNGSSLSNSYLLEKEFGWNGILAEPAQMWHDELQSNRDCFISNKCVWKESGMLVNFSQAAELSTITEFEKSDSHDRRSQKSRNYQVDTITLLDLLVEGQAPHQVDFLSIDTEGSELEILEVFDFERYSFGAICVEHNYTENREKIYSLLSAKGYKRVFLEISDFDDWYVPAKFPIESSRRDAFFSEQI